MIRDSGARAVVYCLPIDTSKRLLTLVKSIRAYEILSDPVKRRDYDRYLRGETGSSSSRRGGDPFFDQPFGFSASAGNSSKAFDLFDELFPEFHDQFGGRGTSRSAASADPMAGFFGGGGAASSFFSSNFGGMPGMGGGGGSGGGASLMDSLFGPGAFSAMPSATGSSRSSRNSEVQRDSPAQPQSSSSSRFSFSTSFGGSIGAGSNSSGGLRRSSGNDVQASSGSGAEPPGWSWSSQSSSTRIVNGRREDSTTLHDSQGNTTVHTTSSDGRQRVTVNGVEQPDHPLLGNGALPPSSSSTRSSRGGGRGSVRSPIVVD